MVEDDACDLTRAERATEQMRRTVANILRLPAFAFLFAACLFGGAAEGVTPKNDYRSPRNKERGFRKSTRLIVLHTTEAHAKSALNKLSERGEAHYCVTEKGEVYRIVDRDREAFHAGRSMWNGKEDCDAYSVGIEVVGYHDKTMPVKQLAALKELIGQLQRIYGLRDDQVVCHSHVAYGAPNTWHKKKHRGRKRCGMLFAMASVRDKLGLKARPKSDPDVRAKRLVQADDYLNGVLYGTTDTMARHYGYKAKKTAVAVKPKPKAAKKPAGKPKEEAKAVAKAKPAAAKPAVAAVKKGRLVTVKTDAAKAAEEEENGGVLKYIGLGGMFKKKAKLIKVGETKAEAAEDAKEEGGDAGRDLQALEALPGYVKGGPVTASNSPYRIAGVEWKAATTYYYFDGKITPGDKIDEKSVKRGTLIFYRKR